MFDEVIVAVLRNYSKTPVFSPEERRDMLLRCLRQYPLGNVSVEIFDGLLADFAVKRGACAIVKGLRSCSDFDYEMRIALGLKRIAPSVESLFLMCSDSTICISSDIVRSLAAFGGDISSFVPSCIIEDIMLKFR